jgi:hypothetical protein
MNTARTDKIARENRFAYSNIKILREVDSNDIL